jgi:hypothetical protein
MTGLSLMTQVRSVVVLLAAVAVVGCRGERLSIEPLELSPVAATIQSADATLAVDRASGRLLLSWVGGDAKGWSLFLARSADGGRSWSTPALVAGGSSAPDEVHPHGESSPRLVAGPRGRLALAWASNVRIEGRKWPAAMVRLARSDDGGGTWSTPITLNDDSAGAPVSHQFHGAAWQGDSGLVVAWLDERQAAAAVAEAGVQPIGGEPDATIYAAASPDFGRSWAPNARLWGAVCPCCRVSLTRRPDGELTAAWRQHFPGSVRDIVVAPISTAAGVPTRVHEDAWAYPGCPHTGPAVVAGHDGRVHTAWYSGKAGASGVFYRWVGPVPTDSAGALVPVYTGDHVPTAHVAVAPLADGGALIAYDVGPDGSRVIRLARIAREGRRTAEVTVPGSHGGGYPQLVILPGGDAIVAYTVIAGDVRGVKAARVRAPG